MSWSEEALHTAVRRAAKVSPLAWIVGFVVTAAVLGPSGAALQSALYYSLTVPVLWFLGSLAVDWLLWRRENL